MNKEEITERKLDVSRILFMSNVPVHRAKIIANFIEDLDQENKQLKEQYCERTDCGGRLGNSKKVERLIQENKELHNKIDKAIELIECSKEHILEHDGSNIYLTQYCIDELLKILKESD